jgi:hypothetical protein
VAINELPMTNLRSSGSLFAAIRLGQSVHESILTKVRPN